MRALRAAGVREQPIFCLQNGIANEPMALRLFSNVHGVTVMMPATYTVPGVVVCHGTPKLGLFDIGRFPSGHDAADAALARAFGESGMAGFVHDDVMASKRGKLLLNLGNALEASLGRGTERGDWPEKVRAEAEGVLGAAGLAWDDVGMDMPRRKELMQMGEIPGEERFGGSTSQSLVRSHRTRGDRLSQRGNRVAGADARDGGAAERVPDRPDGRDRGAWRWTRRAESRRSGCRVRALAGWRGDRHRGDLRPSRAARRGDMGPERVRLPQASTRPGDHTMSETVSFTQMKGRH